MKNGTNDRDSQDHTWSQVLVVTSLGWDLALPIFGGVLLGYYLDRRLDTGHIFTVGLLVLGIITGYYNLLRFIRRVEQRDRRRAEEKKRRSADRADE